MIYMYSTCKFSCKLYCLSMMEQDIKKLFRHSLCFHAMKLTLYIVHCMWLLISMQPYLSAKISCVLVNVHCTCTCTFVYLIP